jgi:xylan 1,4-beta-xylosidase
MYSSYTAASFARKLDLAEQHGVKFEGALTWAFEFEDQPYFAGFRSLATNGIDKPVMNVFRMFSQMGGERIAVESDAAIPLADILASGVRDRPDVSALASLDGSKLCIMVWHYHDDDVPGPAAEVNLSLQSLPLRNGEARLVHHRIDSELSNAYSVWKQIGSPQQPTSEQIAKLETAGKLAMLGTSAKVAIKNGVAAIRFSLPRQAVSLLVVEWDTP